MNITLISNENSWINIAGSWSLCSEKPSKFFSEGVSAATEINWALNHAPSDIGGTINLGVTTDDVDKLLERWEYMQNFSNSIHYELAEFVDIPYTKKASQVMEDVYNLDPKDFSMLEKNHVWASSLQDLVLGIVNVSSARASYETLVATLDCDKPDATLAEVMKDSNYWAVEFEKTNKIRAYATEFYNKYVAKWDSYTDEEKLKLLNKYAKEIGKIIDNTDQFDFITGHILIRSVKFASSDPDYDPQKHSYGYTYAQSRNGIIYISDMFRNIDNPMFDLSFALTVVTHEARHQYQGQAFYNPKRYNLPKYEQTEWFNKKKYPDNKVYWELPWEIDARAYSCLTY